MSKLFINRTHIEGILYSHDLKKKVSGSTSKHPGTEFITGNVSIATDDALTNIVDVHFTYVVATTAKGSANSLFQTLSDIIDGTYKSYVDKDGGAAAVRVRADSAIGLNEFYSTRSGKEELVSVKRNEGGFLHIMTDPLNAREDQRNTFETDIIITSVIDHDAENDKDPYLTIKGAIFDFRKNLLPVTFTVNDSRAFGYFHEIEASSKNPVFTKIKGVEVSKTVEKTITEESAFGDPSVRISTSTRKDFVVTWAMKNPYEFNTEETITAEELTEAMAQREVTLAAMKTRASEYQSNKTTTAAKTTVSEPSKGNFNF